MDGVISRRLRKVAGHIKGKRDREAVGKTFRVEGFLAERFEEDALTTI